LIGLNYILDNLVTREKVSNMASENVTNIRYLDVIFKNHNCIHWNI